MKFAIFEAIVPHNLAFERQDRPRIMRILSTALPTDPCNISPTKLGAKRFESETVPRRKYSSCSRETLDIFHPRQPS
jgi:hypothetical protein